MNDEEEWSVKYLEGKDQSVWAGAGHWASTTGRIWGWPVRQGGCHEDLGVEELGEVSWEGNKARLRQGKGLETSLGGEMVPGYRSPGKPGRGVIYDGT